MDEGEGNQGEENEVNEAESNEVNAEDNGSPVKKLTLAERRQLKLGFRFQPLI